MPKGLDHHAGSEFHIFLRLCAQILGVEVSDDVISTFCVSPRRALPVGSCGGQGGSLPDVVEAMRKAIEGEHDDA
jgi:hypothetical protein